MQLDVNTTNPELANLVVEVAIINKILPELYYLLNEVLIVENKPIPKETKTRIRRVLPAWCSNSFEYPCV